MPTTVYKLGGSLLDLPGLAGRLDRLLSAASTGDRPLLVVGGGAAADVVRDWDRIHALGDTLAHRLAIGAMSFNAALIASLLPSAELVADREQAEAAWSAGRRPVLDTSVFVAAEEPRAATPLPESWEVTGDTVAAWISLCWPADRLVLIKSTGIPGGCPPDEAVRQGRIDPRLPGLLTGIAATAWVNLRGDSLLPTPWPPARSAQRSG